MTLIPKEQLRQWIKEKNMKSMEDVQSAIKELFADTIQEMLEAELGCAERLSKGTNYPEAWEFYREQLFHQRNKKIPQPALEVHHQELQRDDGFACLRKACSNTAKPIRALTLTKFAFNGVALACILSCDSPLFRRFFALYRTAKRRTAQTNAMCLAKSPVLPPAINLLGQYRLRVKAEVPLVRFKHFDQRYALV